MNQRGYYFLANDRVRDLAIAFLSSFREHNSDAELCLVPYDESVSEIVALQDRFRFSVFEDTDLLHRCDRISDRFCGYTDGAFRKLALWDGAFDEFVYIDVDTVVLANVDFVFRFLEDYACLTSHSNLKKLQRWVWKPSIHDAALLERKQIEFSANTGFLASNKGFTNLQELEDRLDGALRVAPHMVTSCKEQPLLNYLIVTSGKPYTSLHLLYYRQGIRDGIALEKWAGIREGRVVGGDIVGLNRPVFLVHWAGCFQPRRIDLARHRMLAKLGLADPEAVPTQRTPLPFGKLWQHYRRLHERADESRPSG